MTLRGRLGVLKLKVKLLKVHQVLHFVSILLPNSFKFIFQRLLLQSLTLVTLTLRVECVITNTDIWPVVLSSALCFALIWVWPFVVDWAQYIRYLTHLLHPHNFTPLHHQWDRGNHRQSLAGIFSHIYLSACIRKPTAQLLTHYWVTALQRCSICYTMNIATRQGGPKERTRDLKN